MAIKKRVWETLLYDLVFKWSGRQDSNLRPSAPKALNSHSSALGFQAISNYLLGSAKFVVTNNYIFDRNLTAIESFRNFIKSENTFANKLKNSRKVILLMPQI